MWRFVGKALCSCVLLMLSYKSKNLITYNYILKLFSYEKTT